MIRSHAYVDRFLRPTVHISSGLPQRAIDGWGVQVAPDDWPRKRVRVKRGSSKTRNTRFGEYYNVKGWPDYLCGELPGSPGPATVACKGRTAFEVSGFYQDAYEIRRESGVSGGLDYRTFSLGYIWAWREMTNGDSWENRFTSSDNPGVEVVTQVKYHLVMSVGRERDRRRLERILGGDTHAIQAVFDWVKLSYRLGRYVLIGVREELWGQDFEHKELYIEGSLGTATSFEPLGRIGWQKLELIDGKWQLQRMSCYHRPRWTTWRPAKHPAIPGWER